MADTEIRVSDRSSGEYVRTIEKTINSLDVNQQVITPFAGGILQNLRLYVQDLGDDTITLPFTAKSDESQSTSATQSQILTRELLPYDLEGVTEEIEKTTQSATNYTKVINKVRFFLDEKLLETLQLNGTVKFQVKVGVKSNNTAGTAHLQQIIFSLVKLTAIDTYTTLGTKTVTVDMSTATTGYVEKTVRAIVDAASKEIATTDKLVLEITTNGKISDATYICTHKISYRADTDDTWVEIGVEELC